MAAVGVIGAVPIILFDRDGVRTSPFTRPPHGTKLQLEDEAQRLTAFVA